MLLCMLEVMEGVLCLPEVPELMCRMILSMPKAAEGVFCLLEVLEVVESGLCLLEVLDVMRSVLLCMLEAVEGVLCLLEDVGGTGGDALCVTLYVRG